MADSNDNTNDGSNNQNDETNNTNQNTGTTDEAKLAALVQAGIDEALKDIKGKLDNAYKERDKANVKLAEAEQRDKEAKLKQLEDDGKHKEALEIKLAEANAKNEVLEKRITELTRDASVREALGGLSFKNEKASKIAFKEIIEDLILNDKGLWVHKSGISVKEHVEKFSKDEDQQFLFNVKTSNGSGSSTSSKANGGGTNKDGSLFKKSQAEVLEMARKGELPNRRK